MHVIVVGAGAAGTLYGGWLLAGGADVSFVARAAQLKALRAGGLTLRGDKGDDRAGGLNVSDNEADLAPADAVLLTVKLYDLDEAARIAASCRAPGGLIHWRAGDGSAVDHRRRSVIFTW